MITGFNTDIEFGGVTYHVQTEDKGLSKPMILSLIYDRGTILASKRLPYDDLLDKFDEKVLAERLQKQHRLMCAAVRAGRIDELMEMTLRESARVKANSEVAVTAAASGSVSALAELPTDGFPRQDLGAPIPKPGANGFGPSLPVIYDEEEPLVEAVTIVEEHLVLPDDAVEIVSEFHVQDRPVSGKLSIEMLGDAVFKGGDRHTLGFMVCRGNGKKVVSDAQIMVKIIGSSFRPVIFHAKTDENGIARVNLQLPNFNAGRAAFLVRAISDGEEIELRRPIAHG
ncbi:MAG TPA: hypothetical protein VK468_08790 [Pyrinomonadaceae bacterium]|nr:hypothetical protein [Pyrinomonadaceae bacterium]